MKYVVLALFLSGSVQAETLHYTINWQSGLSLGEAALHSQKVGNSSSGEARDLGWEFQLTVDAAVPGFTIRDEYKSTSDLKFCSEKLERTLSRGSRKSGETVKFDQEKHTATRESPGNKSTADVADCAHDALAFIQFIRQELAQGRLAPDQPVILGAAYKVQLAYTGTESIRRGENRVDADRVRVGIRGPKADLNLEIYFARDDVRTPVLVKLPLTLGMFTVELDQ